MIVFVLLAFATSLGYCQAKEATPQTTTVTGEVTKIDAVDGCLDCSFILAAG